MGTLLALGMKRSEVSLLFLLEGALLGIAAGMVGVLMIDTHTAGTKAPMAIAIGSGANGDRTTRTIARVTITRRSMP